MPENKLQHYVPKCQLRPFSIGGEGSAINLLNLEREMAVANAPVKGQCARDYFYGEDRILERLLQVPEGQYAEIVKKVERDPHKVSGRDLHTLRDFALLQTFRTFSYVEKLIAVADQFDRDMGTRGELLNLTRDRAVTMAMAHFTRALEMGAVDDLTTVLVINKTSSAFISSDDPSVMTNRYHIQGLGRSTFGLSSSGLIYLMPLSPKAYLVSFDPWVYYVESRDQIIETCDPRDVSSLNDVQYLNARKNVYFRDWKEADFVRTSASKVAPRRPKDWSTMTYFEQIGESDRAEHYRQIDRPEEFVRGTVYLTQLSQHHVSPPHWPGFLKRRLRPKVVDTGTGAGIVLHDLLLEAGPRTPLVSPHPLLSARSCTFPALDHLRRPPGGHPARGGVRAAFPTGGRGPPQQTLVHRSNGGVGIIDWSKWMGSFRRIASRQIASKTSAKGAWRGPCRLTMR